jgi:hypothetical protein
MVELFYDNVANTPEAERLRAGGQSKKRAREAVEQ